MHGHYYLLNNLMELSWVLIVVISCITITITTILLKFSSNNFKPKSNKLKLLPPGPKNVPIITILIWLTRSLKESQRVLRELSSKYGPIITLSSSSSRTDIFISSRYLVYEALVKKATIFADRPKEFLSNLLNSNNQPSITLANYGSLWRLLRGNLTSQILNPSRIKEFESARTWVLDILLDELRVCASGSSGSSSHEGEKKKEIVKVKEHFRYAMFHLLVLMCFGDKMEESRIKQIESTLQELLSAFFSRFWVLNFSQRWLTKIIFPNRWKQYYSIKKKQQDLLIPFIRARKKFQESTNTIINTCYLDTLLNLEIPINSNNTKSSNDRIKKTRKLSEEEIVSLCFEFLTGGTDSTSTTLEWVMANIVKNPKIQTDLYEEIKGYIGENAKKVDENVLPNLCYLKAVILEGLRRHPPGHFLLNHGVTQEVHLGGYVIPKNASINFVVADMGLDPDVWEDPMEFKPERFLKGGDRINVEYHREFVDENGVLKMIPFGAGRRICPGQGLALLHLEYFVANLVWNFEWKGVDGDEIDLCEKQEFTIVMKYPLQAHISPRKII